MPEVFVSTLTPLLVQLKDNQWHSGADLGETLGISRNAIWKQISALDSLGLEVERSKAKGYRLVNAIDPIAIDKVRNTVSSSRRFADCIFEEVMASTNDCLLKLAGPSEPARVCITEQQLAGRGRRGREWVSPYAQNLYISFSWPVTEGISVLEGLSLAVGVSLAELVQQLGFDDIRLKWPNDLFGASGKLGGILVDVTGDPQGDMTAIIGIGLNLSILDSQLDTIGQPAQGLNSDALKLSRTGLAIRVIEAIDGLLSSYAEQGLQAYVERFTQLDMLRGQSVNLMMGERVIEGVAVGVKDDGSYGIQSGDEVQWYSGGEVSLRCK
jgi:BirA family biotin operon repressor/biotin-[acetyl-CoA-carboxylase] ligase